MKKVFVSFAVMALALASCQGKTDASSTDSAAVDSMTVVEQPMAAQTNEAILGTYEGVLPGADGSVTTKITLNADGT